MFVRVFFTARVTDRDLESGCLVCNDSRKKSDQPSSHIRMIVSSTQRLKQQGAKATPPSMRMRELEDHRKREKAAPPQQEEGERRHIQRRRWKGEGWEVVPSSSGEAAPSQRSRGRRGASPSEGEEGTPRITTNKWTQPSLTQKMDRSDTTQTEGAVDHFDSRRSPYVWRPSEAHWKTSPSQWTSNASHDDTYIV